MYPESITAGSECICGGFSKVFGFFDYRFNLATVGFT
jgi:hypothetical protein